MRPRSKVEKLKHSKSSTPPPPAETWSNLAWTLRVSFWWETRRTSLRQFFDFNIFEKTVGNLHYSWRVFSWFKVVLVLFLLTGLPKTSSCATILTCCRVRTWDVFLGQSAVTFLAPALFSCNEALFGSSGESNRHG